MKTPAGRSPTDDSRIRVGQQVLRDEATAVTSMADRLDESFSTAVDLIHGCRGIVMVAGVGKAGWIGQKISATLASTGTPSHFLHPTEAIHGDLGRCRDGDMALVLSNSGETEEIVRLLPLLTGLSLPIIAVTSRSHSHLGEAATILLDMGDHVEAGHLMAPTTSTTLMLALGDALAMAVAEERDFQSDDFARFHPGGSLGKSLMLVEQAMRPVDQCRCGIDNEIVRDVLVRTGRTGRRTGAIMLTDHSGRLTGIFTDSDLVRLFEKRLDSALDRPISEVMTAQPITVPVGTRLTETAEILCKKKISEVPVVDSQDHPQGMLDITDVIELLPKELAQLASSAAADDDDDSALPISNQVTSPPRP